MQNLGTWYSRSAGIGLCLRMPAFAKYPLAKILRVRRYRRAYVMRGFFYAHFVMLLLYNCMATKGSRERITVGISFSHFTLVGDFLSTLCKRRRLDIPRYLSQRNLFSTSPCRVHLHNRIQDLRGAFAVNFLIVYQKCDPRADLYI